MSKAKIGLAAGGVAAGLALGLGLHYLLSRAAPAPPAYAAAASATPAQPQALAPPAPVPQPVAQATGATPVAAIDTAPTARPARATPAAATTPVGSDLPAGAKPGSKNYVPPAPPGGNLTRARFAATQDWLKNAPGNNYSIQLLTAGMHDLRRLEELLERAPGRNLDPANFYVYGVKINEQQHYRLAYGLYPTLAEVSQGIQALPPVYRQFGPYQRSVERMRSQNRQ